MKIQENKVKGELSVFTESFWRYHDPVNELVLIPDGTFNVLVISNEAKIGKEKVGRGVYFIPVLSNSIVVSSQDPIHGLRLKIFSLINLIQCNHIRIEQTRSIFKMDLSAYLINYVTKEISISSTLKDCLNALKELNYELIHKCYSINPNLRDRVNYILDRKGDIRITEMCESFNVSRQGLHKSFKSSLGLGPKELSDIWKLNNYFWLMSQQDNYTISAYDAGYYDQAHSIKQFQSKMGISPARFVRSNENSINYIHSTIERRFSNYYDPDF
ncbi:MAG: helix-turn-helix transcriptional regulator [Flavobacteriales bacterium]|nr:helix-turn-helix transcriptional regulator [Flavobacteriales bacterium]